MQGQRSDVVTARIDQAFERLSLFERRDVFPLQIFGNGEVFRFGDAHRADLSPYAMDYDLQLYGAADEIVPLLIKGELDMAAIPANLAATLYQKTSGGIQAVAVNTLGVLYVVEQGDTVHSMADLKGRTILSTGKGTTPEYVLRYLLTANGLDPDKDVDIQYYSEATEVTAQMASTQDAIAVLPQPYVTAAGLKDDTLRVALDLTAEWPAIVHQPWLSMKILPSSFSSLPILFPKKS